MRTNDPRISLELQGPLALLGIHRADKRNAFDVPMLRAFATALTEADGHPDVRCTVVFAEGAHFSAGLDLASVAPVLASGEPLLEEGLIDPWAVQGPVRQKPLVLALQGICFTLSIELALASDIVVAASDARFAQLEVRRGILPFGGATLRFPLTAGWSNAMRWMLTGDEFDAREAHRMGLVQEVVEPGRQRERAVALAGAVARQAPLAVQATLASARQARFEGLEAAAQGLLPTLLRLSATGDAREGVRAFVERREPHFEGK